MSTEDSNLLTRAKRKLEDTRDTLLKDGNVWVGNQYSSFNNFVNNVSNGSVGFRLKPSSFEQYSSSNKNNSSNNNNNNSKFESQKQNFASNVSENASSTASVEGPPMKIRRSTSGNRIALSNLTNGDHQQQQQEVGNRTSMLMFLDENNGANRRVSSRLAKKQSIMMELPQKSNQHRISNVSTGETESDQSENEQTNSRRQSQQLHQQQQQSGKQTSNPRRSARLSKKQSTTNILSNEKKDQPHKIASELFEEEDEDYDKKILQQLQEEQKREQQQQQQLEREQKEREREQLQRKLEEEAAAAERERQRIQLIRLREQKLLEEQQERERFRQQEEERKRRQKQQEEEEAARLEAQRKQEEIEREAKRQQLEKQRKAELELEQKNKKEESLLNQCQSQIRVIFDKVEAVHRQFISKSFSSSEIPFATVLKQLFGFQDQLKNLDLELNNSSPVVPSTWSSASHAATWKQIQNDQKKISSKIAQISTDINRTREMKVEEDQRKQKQLEEKRKREEEEQRRKKEEEEQQRREEEQQQRALREEQMRKEIERQKAYEQIQMELATPGPAMLGTPNRKAPHAPNQVSTPDSAGRQHPHHVTHAGKKPQENLLKEVNRKLNLPPNSNLSATVALQQTLSNLVPSAAVPKSAPVDAKSTDDKLKAAAARKKLLETQKQKEREEKAKQKEKQREITTSKPTTTIAEKTTTTSTTTTTTTTTTSSSSSNSQQPQPSIIKKPTNAITQLIQIDMAKGMELPVASKTPVKQTQPAELKFAQALPPPQIAQVFTKPNPPTTHHAEQQQQQVHHQATYQQMTITQSMQQQQQHQPHQTSHHQTQQPTRVAPKAPNATTTTTMPTQALKSKTPLQPHSPSSPSVAGNFRIQQEEEVENSFPIPEVYDNGTDPRVSKDDPRIPRWAHTPEIQRALVSQSHSKDVDRIFPSNFTEKTCNLVEVFSGRERSRNKRRPDYRVRTSSANWFHDGDKLHQYK